MLSFAVMSDKPGKDDVHEQRQPNQKAEGVVHDGGDGGGGGGGGGSLGGGGFQQHPRATPVKHARDGAKSDAEAPPKTPDHSNKPD